MTDITASSDLRGVARALIDAIREFPPVSSYYTITIKTALVVALEDALEQPVDPTTRVKATARYISTFDRSEWPNAEEAFGNGWDAACTAMEPSKQRAALEELVRTATEVHRISDRTHEAWIALAAALNEARAVTTPAEARSSKPRVSDSELAGEIANLERLRLNPTGLSTREAYVLLALYELSNRRAFETPDEDKADLLSMAAVVARAGRETNGVKAELMQRASRVLVALAETRQTRRHRGCGPDCTLPAGHLGDHSPVEPTPERPEAETPATRSLFDQADELVKEMRRRGSWGLQSTYGEWMLKIWRPEKAAERTVDGYTCRKCGVWYAGPNGFHECSPENASAELCEGCPPVGYPTDTTRCTPCPRRSEKLSQPRVPQNEHEATLTAIRTRDTESVPTWFKEPPLGACGRAFIDRRWLLKEIDTLRADMAQDQQRLFHLESALAKPAP